MQLQMLEMLIAAVAVILFIVLKWCPGLRNPYSGSLLLIMGACLIGGGFFLYEGYWQAIFPFVFGVMMLRGFKWPEEAKPTRVWLITAFGQMTTCKVYGLTLLLDWIKGVNIVGKEELILKKVDRDIALTKPIRCKDGQYVEGEVSVAFVPDDEDDPLGYKDKDGKWKSGGEKLRDFANVDGIDDIVGQLDDILTTWVQEFGDKHPSEDMETKIQSYAEELLQRIIGMKGSPTEAGNSTLSDTRGLGIRFFKFQVVLKAPDKVIQARVDVQVQVAKRAAEVFDTKTVNLQIAERAKLWKDGVRDESGALIVPATPGECPPVTIIRNMVFQENLEHDGKVTQIINQGGINVAEIKGVV